MRPIQTICVFCGSRSGVDPAYEAAATAFGRTMAQRGLTLVYGGASVGLMGAIANAVLAEGGRAVGVIPKGLMTKEIAHHGLTELFLTETMQERKSRMITLSDAFVALPGGFGTYDELFETLTLAQIGFHDHPNGLLDVGGFFGPLVALLRHTVDASFAQPHHLDLLVVDPEPAALLDKLAAWTPPPRLNKWRTAPDQGAP